MMNCQMCKYREQVLGFEADVGQPQESHHHHVEGIGGGPTNCPCNGDCDGPCRDEHSASSTGSSGRRCTRMTTTTHIAHDHDHDHGHHHSPYPHADHPLGPRAWKRRGG